MSDMTIRPEVCEGVKFLSRTYPEWVDSINFGSLDMGDPESCILGQVGEFLEPNETLTSIDTDGFYIIMGLEGIEDLDQFEWAHNRGFHLLDTKTATRGEAQVEWGLLKHEWVSVVTKLREGKSLETVLMMCQGESE